MDLELPYRAEYAKSSRSSCRGCKSSIGQGVLRLAVMVQSPVFDGRSPQWYHMHCFFSKQRPKSAADIEHLESLRYEDQEKIRGKIGSADVLIVPTTKKGKGVKRDASSLVAKKAALKDFNIEYSKSSRAMCRGCEQKIMKEEIRISKKDFDTDVGKKYGGQDMWHHVTCFAKIRSELKYYESAEVLPGFKLLSKDDQKEVKTQIPAIKMEDVPDIKKIKVEEAEKSKEEKELKEQNKVMFKYRDNLTHLTKQQLIDLLESNGQEIPAGKERCLDRISDLMTFGALEPCTVCKGGQFVYSKFGYVCQGDLTEWTKCNTTTKEPKRRPFTVNVDFVDEFSFLKKYKYVSRTRLFRDEQPTVAIKKEENGGPKVERAAPPLYNMEFVILGKPKRGKDELKKQIVKLGGKVVTKIKNSVMAVIATEEDVEKLGSRMEEVKDAKVHVVPETFVDEAPSKAGQIPAFVMEITICDWGSDPSTRLPPEPSSSKSGGSKSGSIYTSRMPSKVKLKLKDGGAVDPDSGLEDVAHIYQSDGEKWSAVLGKTDIQQNKNSFYKLQLLQADTGNAFWLFRSWGRIGTTIGGTKTDKKASLHEAKREFCQLYEEKSGNMWEMRHMFEKVPGRMHPIDVDYGEDDAVKNADVVDGPSSLPPSVADLMKLIFDVNEMKKLMMEFELDTEKMPLGKLSKKQLLSAYKVLKELQQLVNENGAPARFIDASNRFYTFVPHSFGIENPPILNTEEMIKQKIEMLDNLMELEIAYSLMKSTGSECSLDSYYEKLNTDIGVLAKDSEEYRIIDDYVKNTHAETHRSYELEVQDVYVVQRQGEEKRFKPFRKLHNRKLLWHGSRTTNYAGILSQGLRIAPPEAPVTGYMFGKGIYFADMVSKSANYCCTNPNSPTGLLLLCDVALGNMYEKEKAEYVEKLPKGKHSTKGVGRTHPDPNVIKKINDVEVPLGKPVNVPGLEGGHLLYNEYIVYDVAQVQVKYLLKVNFKYKY